MLNGVVAVVITLRNNGRGKINGDSEKKRMRIKKHTQEKNPHPRCVCARAFAVAADIVKNVRRRQRRR